jgi:hypothetical protein
MLRSVLDWFSQNPDCSHELSFLPDATWYSEALLPSQFLPRCRGDKLAESHTHADGVTGHFKIGQSSKGELTLLKNARQFVVIEAKMGSKLSDGVSHANFYNQAARNIACMAEVLRRSELHDPDNIKLGFYVVAPRGQIKDSNSTFEKYMERNHIRNTIQERIKQYDPTQNKDAGGRDDYEDRQRWLNDHFNKYFGRIDIQLISWEKIINFINEKQLDNFYHKCLKSNGLEHLMPENIIR